MSYNIKFYKKIDRGQTSRIKCKVAPLTICIKFFQFQIIYQKNKNKVKD